jgi:hypothetical protein
MERRDMFQDQIEQLGIVLSNMFAKIMGLKGKGASLELIQTVNQDMKKELDIDDLLGINTDDFVLILEKKMSFNEDNLEKLANNLFLVASEFDNAISTNIYQKCYKIYELIDQKSLTYSHERLHKMQQIKKVLDENALFSKQD